MKYFELYQDLALFLAPPAFAEPLHVGRPNMGRREAFLAYVNEIFDRRWLTNNRPLVQAFEQRMADFLGVKHCVAMCKGTIALEIATPTLELKGGAIMPSYSFIATAHALQWQEITPVFADIDPRNFTIDVKAIESAITDKTKAIIPVHLYGQPVDMDPILEIAKRHGLVVIEDPTQAHGAEYKGREQAADDDEVLSLPMFPELSRRQCEEVSEVISILSSQPEFA